MAKATRTISDAARDACLWVPGSEQFISHGSDAFRIAGGRQFATYSVNHHGDGIVALHLPMPPGSQRYYTESDPDTYFVPAYVGGKGWLGIKLTMETDWHIVATRVRDAAAHVSKDDSLPSPPAIKPAAAPVPMEEFDPLQTPGGKEILTSIRDLCLAFPEAVEAGQWGSPAWKAGKKTFATLHAWRGRITLQTWCGKDLQVSLTGDPRFRVPPYTGHNGWIELELKKKPDRDEVQRLLDTSYRHFALKRMLKTLEVAG